MARYIDADKLLNSLTMTDFDDWGDYDIFYHFVTNAPTADVAEVVRCKDCISFNGDRCSLHSDYYGEHEVAVEADAYCSYGRREW